MITGLQDKEHWFQAIIRLSICLFPAVVLFSLGKILLGPLPIIQACLWCLVIAWISWKLGKDSYAESKRLEYENHLVRAFWSAVFWMAVLRFGITLWVPIGGG